MVAASAWDHPAAFRRSWLAGFTAAVSRRLREAEEAAQAEAEERDGAAGRSTALVLADRTLEVLDAAGQAYPNARTARSRQLSGGGAGQGFAAGQRAHHSAICAGSVVASLRPWAVAGRLSPGRSGNTGQPYRAA